MDERYLSARVGNLKQIAHAERLIYTSGKADGLKVIDIDNGGGVCCTLLEGRCLDISKLSYKGVNLSFLAKPGLVAPSLCNALPGEFVGYFYAGMLYTCGLKNIGPNAQNGDEYLPIHGRLGMTPADDISAEVLWDEGAIRVYGNITLASLFGSNLRLSRTITIPLFGNRIEIEDTVRNFGFVDEEIMLMYHCNFGWPMLSEVTELSISHSRVEARNEIAERGIAQWNTFVEPVEPCDEQVFYHTPTCKTDGLACATVSNKELGIAVDIKFDPNLLPHLIQWKSMSPGDYVLGIEPSTSRVDGVETEKQLNRFKLIKAGGEEKFKIELSFRDI